MTLKQAIISCFRQYATFSGRASRTEYWFFVLFCLVGNVIATTTEAFINMLSTDDHSPTILSGSFGVATIVPGFAVTWRRMHDTGRSGLILFNPLLIVVGLAALADLFGSFVTLRPGSAGIPPVDGMSALLFTLMVIVLAVSPLIILYWLTRPSQPGPNEYGPNPYEVPQ